MRMSPALGVVGLAGLAVTIVVVVVRTQVVDDPAAADPESMLPALLALGALCVVALAATRNPTLAWLAAVAALTIGTIDLASVAHSVGPGLPADTWRWLAIALCISAVLATSAAVAYATERRRRLGSWVVGLGVIGVLVVVAASIGALAAPSGAAFADPADGSIVPTGTLSLVTRAFLVAVLLFVALGLAGDARPAGRRALRRVAVRAPAPRTAGQRLRYGQSWIAAFVDEIAPGRSRAHRAALTERSRLARELHAEVVPAVRRALAEAERDESADRLAASLREVLLEVDALAQAQHAIQLDVGGLVPALEWLAERTEERAGIQVTIDVVEQPRIDAPIGRSPAGATVDGPATPQPPRDVAAAAFRVAGLALENVVRHADGSDARMTVAAGPERVTLEIADDGPGIPERGLGEAAAAGRRGFVDMDAEAASCGAAVVVRTGQRGSGTTVRFSWPA